jgi:hypothetical protein
VAEHRAWLGLGLGLRVRVRVRVRVSPNPNPNRNRNRDCNPNPKLASIWCARVVLLERRLRLAAFYCVKFCVLYRIHMVCVPYSRPNALRGPLIKRDGFWFTVAWGRPGHCSAFPWRLGCTTSLTTTTSRESTLHIQSQTPREARARAPLALTAHALSYRGCHSVPCRCPSQAAQLRAPRRVWCVGRRVRRAAVPRPLPH